MRCIVWILNHFTDSQVIGQVSCLKFFCSKLEKKHHIMRKQCYPEIT